MSYSTKFISDRILSCYIEKSGLGSRGGKIIGFTKTNKPIYLSQHESYSSYDKKDHFDAADHHINLHKKYSKEGDLDNSAHHRNQAYYHLKEQLK